MQDAFVKKIILNPLLYMSSELCFQQDYEQRLLHFRNDRKAT